MSAEMLRRAASLMRERADRTTGGPWVLGDDRCVRGDDREILWDDSCDEKDNGLNDGIYIASWHPAVALAVAKAMDDVAHAWEIADAFADGWVYDTDDNHCRFDETVDGGWLAVARAYLGSDS